MSVSKLAQKLKGSEIIKIAGEVNELKSKGAEIANLTIGDFDSTIYPIPDVLLLDEPTNNLDPASREEILGALRTYKGAVVLVSHDEGAVAALEPERVLLLPDGVEDHWGPDYLDLVALA